MEYKHGCYTARWEGALLIVRQIGDATVDDVVWVGDLMLAQAKLVGPIDVLADLSQLGHVPPDARKQFSQHEVNHHIRSIAIFGVSVAMRAVATLALRASFLFSKKPGDMAFFSTENEARAWIHRQRSKRH